jgi:hypothetical protein
VPSRLHAAVSGVLATLLLAGCGSPAQDTAPAARSGGASLANLNDKVGSIAQDECATKPAATVFPNCPRFVTEVANAAVAAKGAAPGHPGADALTAAATGTADAVAAFVRDGCVLSPGQPAPPAETCGPDLTRIQEGLRTLRGALATADGTPTG